MLLYVCPECDANLDRSRLPPRYPWTLIYTFRCTSCAAMLRWDALGPCLLGILLCAGWGVVACSLLWNLTPVSAVDLLRPVGFVALGVACWIGIFSSIRIAPVVHSDE